MRYVLSRSGLAFILGSSALVPACGVAADGGIGEWTLRSSTTTCAIQPVIDQSLLVTNPTVLAQFSLERVLDHIVTTGSTTHQTPLGLYQQLVDTLNTKATGSTNGPHCDDDKSVNGDLINGFETECPRQEGTLSRTSPFPTSPTDQSTPNAFQPTAVVNRFDLAPADGSNCGEYRVIFAKNSGIPSANDRMFIIFEGTLPNPKPSDGLAACLPVAQFWDNLSTIDVSTVAGAKSLAADLSNFYFDGLKGFSPVVQAKNYGIGGGTDTGQIRTNMFMNATGGQGWELREFHLAQSCVGTACTLIANDSFTQTNPDITLFSGSTPQALAFQSSFVAQVPSLAADSVPLIGMVTPSEFDSAESVSLRNGGIPGVFPADFPLNDYLPDGSGGSTTPSPAFLKQITAAIAKLEPKSTLTADNILSRATSQSCAGCHELTQNNQDLGGKLTWPSSEGFTQVDELSNLSPALVDSFLPFRSRVLVEFIDEQQKCAVPEAGDAASGPGSASDAGSVPPVRLTISGALVGSAS